jgi:xylulokinase
MVEDEGAALGGALQAAWCLALREGRKAKLTDFTTGIVALNEATRCTPDAKRKAVYRKLQDQHEAFSRAMRPTFG